MLYPFMDKGVAWVGDTVKAAILLDSYTFDETDEFLSDLSAHEASGGGYSRVTLANKTEVYTDPYHKFSCDDFSWSSLTLTGARWIVLFKDTGTAATSPLIGAYDFGVGVNGIDMSAADLDVTIGPSGVWRVNYKV